MKQKTKRMLKRVGIFLLVAILGGLTASFAMTAANGFDRELNPENIIDVDKYTVKDGDSSGKGIKVSVNDDGVIKLNGEASENDEYTVTTLSLAAGTYTISGYDSNSKGVTLKAVYNGTITAISGTTYATFTLETETSVSIVITIAEDYYCFNTTIKPVLVEGDEAGDFYKK